MRILPLAAFVCTVLVCGWAFGADALAPAAAPAGDVTVAVVDSTAVAVESTAAQADSAEATKLADIRKLMAINNSDNMAQQLARQMVDRLKAALPQVPEEFWQKFSAEVKPEELQDRMAAIYAKYLTDEDVNAFLAFYETPTGKKMLEAMPKVQMETVQAAQGWSKEVVDKAKAELEKGGYIPGSRSTAPGPMAPMAPSMESPAPAQK